MTAKYNKPELIDLTGMDAFGDCTSGSSDGGYCRSDGGDAFGESPGSCIGNGLIAFACSDGLDEGARPID